MFMPETRERFEPWVERNLRQRYPELVVPLMAAIDAFDAIWERGERTPDNLDKVVKAASSTRRPLYENASGLMQRLTTKWPEAAVAVLKMSKSPKSHVRFNAILCLGKGSPDDLVDAILRSGLQDKSARVRSKAADWAGRLGNTRLTSELTAASVVEDDAETRSCIDFELRLLRDGYILEKCEEGWFDVTVRMDDGGVCTETVNESRLKSEGIEAIATALRRHQ
jgi:hypothetical protein